MSRGGRQRPGDLVGDRYTTSRQRDHQRLLLAEALEGGGEAAPGFPAVDEEG